MHQKMMHGTPVIYQCVLLFHIIWLAGIDKSSSMCMLQKMTHHKGSTEKPNKNLFSFLFRIVWLAGMTSACMYQQRIYSYQAAVPIFAQQQILFEFVVS
jgi:hypothetical protein